MISPKCFSAEWIQQKRKELAANDPFILERSIHALALLGHLAATDLPFVFKGGTSLLLHLSSIRRLSTDIDIICGVSKTELDTRLKSICRIAPFIGYQEDERGYRGLPNRRHFKFIYNKIGGGSVTPYILLDVVEEKECLLPLISKPIKTNFIEIEKELSVKIPTVEGLLGD